MFSKLKKGLFIGATFAFVATAGISLSGCGDTPKGAEVNAQDFYAMAAISSVNYLQANSSSSQALLTANDTQTTTTTTRPDSISSNDVTSLSNYMGMFQGILSADSDKFFTNSTVTETDEYYGEYNLKMTLSIPQTNGQTQQIVMYYKEINTETKEELDDNEVEMEINSTLAGIIIFDNKTYSVTGQREYEQEGNETEVEIKLTTRSQENNQDYIVIEHEKDNEEVEYQYSIYQSGKLINETNVEFENERNQKVLELEFLSNSETGKEKVKYEITQDGTDENQFNVKVKSVNNEATIKDSFTITITNTGYTFTYSNGFTETV